MTMLNETTPPPMQDDVSLLPVIIDNADVADAAQPVPVEDLSWSQLMTLKSYFVGRALGGIAMEHFENKPWLVPVYMAPSPIPGKSPVIYAYMAAATLKSDDPDLVRLRAELASAFKGPVDLSKVLATHPDLLGVSEKTGRPDISYKTLWGTIKKDFGEANKQLINSFVRQYPGLFVGVPLALAAREANLNDIHTPFRVGQRHAPLPQTVHFD